MKWFMLIMFVHLSQYELALSSVNLDLFENIVDVKMPRERVVIDDEHEYTNKDGSDPFYKE